MPKANPIVKPEITDAARKRFPSYTEGAIEGVLLLESLDETQLRSLLTGRENATRRAVVAIMGESTNPTWITSQAAQALYERDIIGHEEFDAVMQRI